LAVTERDVLDALRPIQDPDLKRDIVSLGFVRNVRIESDTVRLEIRLTTPACPRIASCTCSRSGANKKSMIRRLPVRISALIAMPGNNEAGRPSTSSDAEFKAIWTV